jgi:hypothetical protein
MPTNGHSEPAKSNHENLIEPDSNGLLVAVLQQVVANVAATVRSCNPPRPSPMRRRASFACGSRAQKTV